MIASPPETVDSFTEAANERFAEGTLLLGAGHSGGAVYLFGYVAELVLKAAVFRHFGYAGGTVIEKPQRTAIEAMMKTDSLAPKGHDILKWAKWLVMQRGALTGTAYPQAYGLEIERQVDVIDARWSPDLRYCRFPFSFAESLTVQQSARWLLAELPNM